MGKFLENNPQFFGDLMKDISSNTYSNDFNYFPPPTLTNYKPPVDISSLPINDWSWGIETPQKKQQESLPFTHIFGGIGFASGVVYAFHKKTGFWKGWGIAIIGGLCLYGIGYGIDSLINKNKNK